MQRKGFITPIITVVLLVASYFLVLHFFGKTPNLRTQQLATELSEYPNAKTWEVSHKARICEPYINRCTEPQSVITFKSDDLWRDIYHYYKLNLTADDWRTESHIITSIPTSIILTNNEYFDDSICSLTIKEDEKNLLGLLESKSTGIFSIKTTCS